MVDPVAIAKELGVRAARWGVKKVMGLRSVSSRRSRSSRGTLWRVARQHRAHLNRREMHNLDGYDVGVIPATTQIVVCMNQIAEGTEFF